MHCCLKRVLDQECLSCGSWSRMRDNLNDFAPICGEYTLPLPDMLWVTTAEEEMVTCFFLQCHCIVGIPYWSQHSTCILHLHNNNKRCISEKLCSDSLFKDFVHTGILVPFSPSKSLKDNSINYWWCPWKVICLSFL